MQQGRLFTWLSFRSAQPSKVAQFSVGANTWNTNRMQQVVDRWRKQGMTIEDAWLRRLGPVHFGHINFRGVFSFGIERYADALMQVRRVNTGRTRA